MRIVVHGQQAFGKSVLEALLERGENVVGVYCAPDPAGGRVDPLKEAALARGLPVHQPRSFRKDPTVRDEFASLLDRSQLLIDGTTPRVLANAGMASRAAATVAITAFAHEDRPGYGIGAECRGGWAARYDPPRLGRVSVADPIAGLLAALIALDVLTTNTTSSVRKRVSLEDAVGHLFSVEAGRA